MKAKIIINSMDEQHSESVPDIEININYDKKKIYFYPAKANITLIFMLLRFKQSLRIITQDGKKITTFGTRYHIKSDIYGKDCITATAQTIYISNCFIETQELDNNFLSATVYFGTNNNMLSNKAISFMKNDTINFEYGNKTIYISNEHIKIVSTNISQSEFKDIYIDILQILYILIGYFPPINKIIYKKYSLIIEEYYELPYLFYTAYEYIRKDNILVNVNSIKDWSNLITDYRKMLSEIPEKSIHGLFYSTSYYNKYSDIQLCNLIQAIDGFTTKIYKNQIDIEKSLLVDQIIDFVFSLNVSEKYKNNFKNFINQFRSLSLKERLKLFCNTSPYVLQKESLLESYYKEKTNKCLVFSKKNKLFSKCLNERNSLSHMGNKDELLTPLEKKIYLYKFLLIFRINIIKLLKLDNQIISSNLEENIQNIESLYLSNLNVCQKCEFCKKNTCELLKIKLKNKK